MSYTEHMIEHLAVAQLLPIVMVLALRDRRRLALPPAATWLAGVGVMITVALPPLVHIADQDVMLAWMLRVALVCTGFLFWERVLPRAHARAMKPATAVAYLVTACFATTLAGIYIAFAGTTTDQQIAGLVMWVPCCMVFLSAVLFVIATALAGERAAAR